MEIEKPIFLVGSGRSGTTIFYNLLSTHPQVCWFSNYTDKFVYCKFLPLLHRTLDFPFWGRVAKKYIILSSGLKFNIRPTEASIIYHDYCGFKHDLKTTEKDLQPELEKKFKETIKRHLILTGKTRFLSKQTANNQRIRLINEMFKDAFFIHIIRDGRAVSNSLLNVKWWNDFVIWWLGEKATNWDAEGRELIELCGLHWKNNVEEILRNIPLFEDRYIEIRYETFVMDVRGTMQRVTNFCELRDSKKFFEMLPPTLSNMNYKWHENLTETQTVKLNKTIKDILNQLNYD
jgi:hypothetical protein